MWTLRLMTVRAPFANSSKGLAAWLGELRTPEALMATAFGKVHAERKLVSRAIDARRHLMCTRESQIANSKQILEIYGK